MRMLVTKEHPNIVRLKHCFYSNGDKVPTANDIYLRRWCKLWTLHTPNAVDYGTTIYSKKNIVFVDLLQYKDTVARHYPQRFYCRLLLCLRDLMRLDF